MAKSPRNRKPQRRARGPVPAPANRPFGDYAAGGAPPELPDGQSWVSAAEIADVLDVQAAMASALDDLSADDLLGVLEGSHAYDGWRSAMLRILGMPHAATVNRAMANQLLARARTAPFPDPDGVLHFNLSWPTTSLIALSSDPRAWNVALAKDPLEVVRALGEDEPTLTTVLNTAAVINRCMFLATSLMPAPLVRVGLIAAIADEAACAAVALSMLSAYDADAADAYDALEEMEPGRLPVRAAGDLTQLGTPGRVVPETAEQAAELDGAAGRPPGTSWYGLDEAAAGKVDETGDDETGDDETGAVAEHSAGDVRYRATGFTTHLIEDLGLEQLTVQVLRSWSQVAVVLRAAADDIDAGDRPKNGALEAADTFMRVVTDLADLWECTPSRDGLQGSLDAAEAALARGRQMEADVQIRRALLQQLSALAAPAAAEADASLVRAAAVRRLEGTAEVGDPDEDALSLLHELARIGQLRRGGDAVSFEDFLAAEQRARTSFSHATPLVVAASLGDVTFPPPSEDPAEAAQVAQVAEVAEAGGFGTASAPATDVTFFEQLLRTTDRHQDIHRAATAAASREDATLGAVDEAGDGRPVTDVDQAGAPVRAPAGPDPVEASDPDAPDAGRVAAQPAPGEPDADGLEGHKGISDSDPTAPTETRDDTTSARPKRPTATEQAAQDGTGQSPHAQDAAAHPSHREPGSHHSPSPAEQVADDADDAPDPAAPALDDLALADLTLDDLALDALDLDDLTSDEPATSGDTLHDPLEDTDGDRDAWPSAAAEQEAARHGARTASAAGRFGLAADILRGAGAEPASIAARELAAYAAQLSDPVGPLAHAFSATSAVISREALSEDRDGHLLAWAAAARAAVTAPNAGPGTVLPELRPSISDLPALDLLTETLIDAAHRGIALAATADQVTDVTASEDRLRAASDEVATLLSDRGRRVLKFAPLNKIYSEWLNPDGELGRILDNAAAGQEGRPPADPEALDASVLDLRGHGIDRTKDRYSQLRRSSQLYDNAARDMANRWEHVLDVVAEYATSLRAASAARRPSGESQTHTQAVDLRTRLMGAIDGLETDLATFPSDTASAVSLLLAGVLDACRGTLSPRVEPSPAWAAHHELLALCVPLDPATLTPPTLDPNHADQGGSTSTPPGDEETRVQVPADNASYASPALSENGTGREVPDGHDTAAQWRDLLPDLLALAEDDETSPTDLYAELAAANLHDLSAELVDELRRTGSELAQTLSRRRREDVDASRDRRDAALDALGRDLDARRMSGVLSEGRWSQLSHQVQELRGPARTDFHRVSAAIERIGVELAAAQSDLVGQFLERLTAATATSMTVARYAEVIRSQAQAGQLGAAESSLASAEAGEELPSATSEATDHVTAFFPGVPSLLTGALPPGRLFDNLSDAGLDSLDELTGGLLPFSQLSPARRSNARNAVEAMRRLARLGQQPAQLVDMLRPILAEAGIELRSAKIEQTRPERYLIAASDVATLGSARTPSFGSAMTSNRGGGLRLVIPRVTAVPVTLVEWVRDLPADTTVIAIWPGPPLRPADWRALADASRGRKTPVLAVLDTALLAYLCTQDSPQVATFEAVVRAFTSESPYKDVPGDTAREMFYGRRRELAQVLDMRGPSIVSGGRQMGKSALVKWAHRQFETRPGCIAIDFDIHVIGAQGDTSGLWPQLWNELSMRDVVHGQLADGDQAAAVHNAVKRWLLEDESRQLLLLLDEADAFLDADAAENQFVAVNWFRRLMDGTDHRFKVVFVGLHRTARFDSLPNQPLSHLGHIGVGPLSPQHAHELITRPLQALGFRFVDPVGTPARILALANNMPALLQLFGAALVSHLTARPVPDDAPPQDVTDDDIDQVWADPNVKASFLEKYRLTLNLDPRYRVIAYAVAYAAHVGGVGAGLSLRDLSAQVQEYWPEGFVASSSDEIRSLIVECVDLGLLAGDARAYRMRTPTVWRLLGTEDEVLDTLTTASETLQLPAPTRGAHRRRIAPAGPSDGLGTVCPLTERQLGQLADTPGVTVITGVPDTGIHNVIGCLSAIVDGHGLRGLRRVVTADPTPKSLTDVARVTVLNARPGQASTTPTDPSSILILVDATGLSGKELSALLGSAAAVADHHRGLRVAVTAGVKNVGGWLGWADRIELARLDRVGLRLLSDEESLPFHDPDQVGRLAAATGGWTCVLDHVRDRVRADTGVTPTAQTVLSDTQAWVSGRSGLELARQAGARSSDPAGQALAAALTRLADLSGPDTLLNLVDLLVLADADRPVRGAIPARAATPRSTADTGSAARAGAAVEQSMSFTQLAAAAGCPDIRGLLEALTSLGWLDPIPGGMLRPEPLLVAALGSTASRSA